MDTKREFIPIFEESIKIGYEELNRLTGIRMVDRTNEQENIFLDVVATTIDGRTVLLEYAAGFAVNKDELKEAFEEATVKINSLMWKIHGRNGVDPYEIYYFVKMGIVKAEKVHPSMTIDKWKEILRVG